MASDPFEEERKYRRLLDEAMAGLMRGVLDYAKIGSDLSKTAMYSSFFDVGSLASTRAFQENLASSLDPALQSAQKLMAQLTQLGVLDRIAAQQSEIMRVSGALLPHIENGIGSLRAAQRQIDLISEAASAATPYFDQLSRSFGVQSALAESLRGLSKHLIYLDSFSGASIIRESAAWADLKNIYDFDDDISVSEAIQEIVSGIEEPERVRHELNFEQFWLIIQILFMVWELYRQFSGAGDFTDADRNRARTTAEAVERIEANQQLMQLERAIAEASALAEASRINKLPKAFVIEAANIRRTPSRKGERVARLEANAILAIEARNGNWLRVIYADPLTGRGAEGWVYQSSVELLSRTS